MPLGKPANARCVQLSAENYCLLFGDPQRPAVCRNLKPAPDMCGANNSEAFALLEALEQATAPSQPQKLVGGLSDEL